MITVFITIGIALVAILILIVAYLEEKELGEWYCMRERRWLCEERVLKAEKAVALEALEKIKNIKAKDVIDNPEAAVYKCQSIASEALTALSHD